MSYRLVGARSMIDLHCHVLPGIDDGPGTIGESVELARVAAREGICTIVATPHVSTQHPNDSLTIASLAQELNLQLRARDIEVSIRTGAEIAVTRAHQISAQEMGRLALGGGQWLLIEPPFTPVAERLDAMILAIMKAGHRVLIAHPERCPALHRDPRTLGELVRAGALASVTSGSLIGRFGERIRRFAQSLLDEHMVHNVASDAHDLLNRRPTLAADLRDARLGALAEWLTVEVPMAILDGTEIPKRPANAAGASAGTGGFLAHRRRE